MSSAYQLSILAGMGSLVYFVFDVASGHALLLKSMSYPSQPSNNLELAQELDAIFAREELLSYLYRRVKILMPDESSVLVPSRLYNDLEKATYFRELTDKEPSLQIQSDDLNGIDAHVVYPADTNLMGLIKKQFPTSWFYSKTTPLLLGFRSMADSTEVHTVFAHFSEGNLHIAYFEKRALQFYNTYSCNTASDVLYFTLLVFNQFGLDPSRAPLRLSGQLLEDSDVYRTLSRYIANLGFIAEPGFLKFSRKFSEIPAHFFFDVYALALCK